jgi:hypothetical protein
VPAQVATIEERLVDDKEDICERARKEHERLMREDPKYRAEYERVHEIWEIVLGNRSTK